MHRTCELVYTRNEWHLWFHCEGGGPWSVSDLNNLIDVAEWCVVNCTHGWERNSLRIIFNDEQDAVMALMQFR